MRYAFAPISTATKPVWPWARATSSSFAVRDKLTALRGALGVALAAGAVFAVVFLAIQSNQLTDLVIETFRMGPER